jgi:uncharacterized protein
MSAMRLSLTMLRETFALCRLGPDDPLPLWAATGPFTSITRTPDELSIVCPATSVPPDTHAVRDWRCLKVDGPLDLSLTGIMAALSGQLAAAGIAIFPIATYDTDYIFVREADTGRAVEALTAAGHTVHGEDT